MTTPKVAFECQNKRAREHKGDPKYCNACRRVYCDDCYEAQLVHEDELNRRTEHEKTDLDVANFVLTLFQTVVPPEERERQHQDNIYSKWFGTVIDEGDRSYFHDFGGFGRLLQEAQLPANNQYPSLISFVGDTGAGKSTLINGILKLPVEITQLVPKDILSPVMGTSFEQIIPTSGDVHLFCDPLTQHTSLPIFYADCEGMDGGEVDPASAKCLSRLAKMSDLNSLMGKQREMSPPITRAWAVKELYPRILFPFSDVVCYVTRNPRRFEHHLETLLLWADRAIDKTTNQPMLPHAFIIINAFTVDEAPEEYFRDWWDAEKVTSEFLRMRSGLVNSTTSTIGTLTHRWKTRGRDITSLHQLIQCYYRGFKVICIPELKSTQHSHITKQYRTLQDAIAAASAGCRKYRQDLGFLMSAESLQGYFEMAFDHFTTTPDIPFNFLSAALLRAPVTPTLKDHICKLAIRYMKSNPTKTGKQIFSGLGPWVASCIFLNSHRFELPNNDVADMMVERYEHFCKEAQFEFYDRSWPCEAVDKKGSRCVNIKSTHTSKGHQNSNGFIFAANDPEYKLTFKSSFDTYTNRTQANEIFLGEIQRGLERRIRKYKKRISTNSNEPNRAEMKKAVAEIHMATFEGFRLGFGERDLISHRTCFCCLASSPSHKLYCGHIICQFCLEDYSNKDHHLSQLILQVCPLCGVKGQQLKFQMQPPKAGLRILCLDGGGIRSIIQLAILEELENAIDLNIPIETFFDLIVGTSGGGIVAAGLGLKNLRLPDCITMFKEFAKGAFVKRPAIDWPLVGKLVLAHHHGRYKTSALEDVLRTVFGEDSIFGAQLRQPSAIIPSLKVAVTATSSNRKTFLFTNYNRASLENNSPKERKSEEVGKEQDDHAETGDRDSIYGGVRAHYDELYTNVEDKPEASSGANSEYFEAFEGGVFERHPVTLLEEDSKELDRETTNRTSSDKSSKNDGKNVNEDSSSESSVSLQLVDNTDDLSKNCGYEFFRGEDETSEMKTWEAIRATSAAPGYFKSFSHGPSKYTFDDGALRCNNPVPIADKERKVLWPHLSKQDPDIMLSIGTGFDPNPPVLQDINKKLPKKGIKSFIEKMITLGSAAITDDMDCEITWKEYTEGLGIESNDVERLRRYQRLNPHLKTPVPTLDDVTEVDNLQKKGKDYVLRHMVEIMEIAHTLIGSLFYFELENVTAAPEPNDGSAQEAPARHDLVCTGTIKCRIVSPALTQRMQRYADLKSSKPRSIFLIGEKNGSRKELEVSPRADTAIPDKQTYDVCFNLKYTNNHDSKGMCIFLSIWEDYKKAVCISGFPRPLVSEAKSLMRVSPKGRLSFSMFD